MLHVCRNVLTRTRARPMVHLGKVLPLALGAAAVGRLLTRRGPRTTRAAASNAPPVAPVAGHPRASDSSWGRVPSSLPDVPSWFHHLARCPTRAFTRRRRASAPGDPSAFCPPGTGLEMGGKHDGCLVTLWRCGDVTVC